ncbi:hypothetical protein BKA69DRAFT_1063720 [Paraphysoderma sedebokerense]|nr:hypothetical protein BKA69DRAFT_1063720 [Paraphysoderma sedebokerense]
MSKSYKTTFQLSKRQRLSKRISRQTHTHMSTSSGSMSYEYDVKISSVIVESSATFSNIVGSKRKRTSQSSTAPESIIPVSFRYRDPNRGRMYEIPQTIYHAFAFRSVYEPYFFTNQGHLLGSSIHAKTTDFVDFIFYGNLSSSLNSEQLGYQKWSDSFVRALGRGYVLGDSFHHPDMKDLDSTVQNEESLVMRSLEPLEYVRLPNKLEPLPNEEEPSDHFFVMCRFLLTDGCDEK